MPWYTIIPPRADHPFGAHAWVPIDDESCWAWSINYHPHKPLSDTQLDAMRDGAGIHVKYPARQLHPARQQVERLSDRSRGAEAGPHL